jgi:hypothetical protein
MSVLIESERSVYLGAQAFLIEEGRELAWAERHVVRNPALKYVLGRFVEADQANQNGHIFDRKELEVAHTSIPNSPLNLLHQPRYIVGNFVAAEMLYPTGEKAASENPSNPYIEALASFWRYYFPDEFTAVERAHQEGSLFFSMECVPKTVNCAAVCGQTYQYDGRQSPTYCDHLNQAGAKKRLGEPHFTGGALIMPPAKPGWNHADVTQLSGLMARYAKEAEVAHDQISQEFGHLDASRWEAMVAQLMGFAYREVEGEWGRDFSTAERKQLAAKGHALPDGSYPIVSPQTLSDAIQAIGRAGPGKRAQVIAHIKKRAAALGLSSKAAHLKA